MTNFSTDDLIDMRDATITSLVDDALAFVKRPRRPHPQHPLIDAATGGLYGQDTSFPPADGSEREIAQALNRGDLSIEDYMHSHPHLIGEALAHQHRREARQRVRKLGPHAEASEREGANRDLGVQFPGEHIDLGLKIGAAVASVQKR